MGDTWDDDWESGAQAPKQYESVETGVGFGGRGRGFDSFSNMKESLPRPGLPSNSAGDCWDENDSSGWNNNSVNSYGDTNAGSDIWGDASAGNASHRNTTSQKNDSSWNDNGWNNNSSSGWNSNSQSNGERRTRNDFSDQEDFPRGGGMKRGRECFKCKQEGHMSRDCPNGDSRSGGRGRECFKCHQEGHMSRDCPNGDSQSGGRGRGCFSCGQDGHISKDCPNGGSGRRGGGGGRTCHKCGEEGHISRECPNPGDGSSRGGGRRDDSTNEPRKSGCFNCGESGHMSKDCPNPQSATGPEGKPRSTYIPPSLDYSKLYESGLSAGINFAKYDKIPFKVTGKNPPPAISSFNDVDFVDVLRDNISRCNYQVPTPVQKQSIPIILNKRDLMACAQTGSGKTAAFLLPMIQEMITSGELPDNQSFPVEPLAVIIAPTRELAIQIYEEACKYSQHTGIKPQILYGGTSVSHQSNQLREGCHILVATVGRLWDFVGKGRVNFFKLKYMVLDEADRILDLGFLEEVRKFFQHSSMPEKGVRQTLMFSATFPNEIQKLASDFMQDYLHLAVGLAGSANSDITQVFFQVAQFDKRDKLLEILADRGDDRTLVFVEKKRTADFIASYMSQNNLPSTSIHGDRMQPEREEALRDFRTGRMPILVATAVAARGLDIKGVQHVINYDLPQDVDEYIHRIGRTGRLGNLGKATSFYDSSTDRAIVRGLVDVLAKAMQEVPEWLAEEARSGGDYIPSRSNQRSGRFPSRDVRTGNQDYDDWSHNTESTASNAQFAMDQPLTGEESWD